MNRDLYDALARSQGRPTFDEEIDRGSADEVAPSPALAKILKKYGIKVEDDEHTEDEKATGPVAEEGRSRS